MILRHKKKKIIKGAPMPLFERLIDTKPQIKSEDKVQNFLTLSGLRQSIANELANIFDSRIGSKVDLNERSKSSFALMPEQFGVRDFAALTAQSDSGKRAISSHIRAAILRFEPRLLNPKVRIIKAEKEEFSVNIAISGEVIIDDVRRKIQFPMILSNILGQK